MLLLQLYAHAHKYVLLQIAYNPFFALRNGAQSVFAYTVQHAIQLKCATQDLALHMM